jgi:siroheme synthase-like protein
MSSYYPVALDLQGRRCVVVGGGPVAGRKVTGLVEAGAAVIVVAPQVCPALDAVALVQEVELRRRPFTDTDLDDAFLVIVATDDPAVNRQVVEEARQRRVLVNAADDPANCDFILPAIVRRGEVQIAATTGGRSPALARHLRERLEALIPAAYGELAGILGAIRSEMHRDGVAVDSEAWQRAIDDALDLVEAGRAAEAANTLRVRLIATPQQPGR